MTKQVQVTLTLEQLESIYLGLIHRNNSIEDAIQRGDSVDYWQAQKEAAREAVALMAAAYDNLEDIDTVWGREDAKSHRTVTVFTNEVLINIRRRFLDTISNNQHGMVEVTTVAAIMVALETIEDTRDNWLDVPF